MLLEARGGDELVLQVRDPVGEGLGREALGVDAQLAHDKDNQTGGIGSVKTVIGIGYCWREEWRK